MGTQDCQDLLVGDNTHWLDSTDAESGGGNSSVPTHGGSSSMLTTVWSRSTARLGPRVPQLLKVGEGCSRPALPQHQAAAACAEHVHLQGETLCSQALCMLLHAWPQSCHCSATHANSLKL